MEASVVEVSVVEVSVVEVSVVEVSVVEVSVCGGPTAQPRLVLQASTAVYGPAAF